MEIEVIDPPLYNLIPEGKCRNCGTEIASKYCPECGQKAGTQRFTIRTCLSNIFTALLNLDNSSIRTFRVLFTHPGQIMQEYICGRRISYMNPFTLLIVLCTVYGIFYGVLNLFFDFPPTKVVTPATTFEGRLEQLIDSASESLLVRTILMLPVYAYFTQRLLKKLIRKSLNYTEIVFMTAYISCQKLLVDMFFLPLMEMYPNASFKAFYFGLYLLLTGWALRSFFQISWKKAVWKSALIYFYSWGIFVLLIAGGLIVAIIGGVIGYVILRIVFELNKAFFEISYIAGIVFFFFFTFLPLYFIFRKRVKRLIKRIQVKIKDQ